MRAPLDVLVVGAGPGGLAVEFGRDVELAAGQDLLLDVELGGRGPVHEIAPALEGHRLAGIIAREDRAHALGVVGLATIDLEDDEPSSPVRLLRITAELASSRPKLAPVVPGR